MSLSFLTFLFNIRLKDSILLGTTPLPFPLPPILCIDPVSSSMTIMAFSLSTGTVVPGSVISTVVGFCVVVTWLVVAFGVVASVVGFWVVVPCSVVVAGLWVVVVTCSVVSGPMVVTGLVDTESVLLSTGSLVVTNTVVTCSVVAAIVVP